MTRGRAEPLALKILKGTDGRDTGGRRLPALPPVERVAPTAPPEVAADPHALAFWELVVGELDQAQVLRRVDSAALSVAALSYAHFQRLEAALAERVADHGGDAYLSESSVGTPALNPLWRARDQAQTALLKALAQCGLTPVSEARLASPPDQRPPDMDHNPFA